jgi:hypothetical protein
MSWACALRRRSRSAPAGRGHRRATAAGPRSPGPRWDRARRATAPSAPRVVAGVLAARAAPPLGVPGPAPADGLLPAGPPTDVHRGGAPAWDAQRGLQPDAAARLCHAPLKASSKTARSGSATM